MGITDMIKKDAISNRTKIQSSEAAQLEKIFNQMFYLEKDIKNETAFIKQVMTRGADTQERIGLHASAMLVGEKDFCMRAQVLSLLYKQPQGEQVQVSLKRIFEEGNAIHEKWQRLFIRAGYASPKDCDYTLFNKKYMMSYTPDVIITIPEFNNGLPVVVEIKSVNTFQFQKMTRHPSAWKQCQWYMHQTGINKGIVLCEDKNTQDFKIEVYDYDDSLCAPYIERSELIVHYYHRVLNEHKMVKRSKEATSPDCKKCKKCFMREACWNIGAGRIRIK